MLKPPQPPQGREAKAERAAEEKRALKVRFSPISSTSFANRLGRNSSKNSRAGKGCVIKISCRSMVCMSPRLLLRRFSYLCRDSYWY